MRTLLVGLLCVWSTAAAAQTPIWRTVDAGPASAALAACLAEAEGEAARACIDAPQRSCAEGVPLEEASTTAFARACNWRAIAAWEEALAAARAELLALMSEGERRGEARAHAAWEAFVTENVRAYAARYEGGTLANVVAGEVRARMVAERTLEARRWLAERQIE